MYSEQDGGQHMTTKDARTVFLLDAMALAYRAYFAFMSRPRINSRGLNTSAVYGFTTTLIKLIRDYDLTYAAVVFDASERTFRNELYADYKAHRDPPPEELISNLPLIKQIAEALAIPVFEVQGVEADDVIGTLAKKAEASGDRAIIVSPDKDFQQLLSDKITLFKPSRRGEDFDHLTAASFRDKYAVEPIQFIDILALMGDKADNVPGIYGIGEKTAQKLIGRYGTVENLVRHAPEVSGKRAREGLLEHPDMAHLSKTLVTIKVDVPLMLDWDALKRGAVTAPAPLGLFRQLEFRTLLDRLTKERPTRSSAELPVDEASRAAYDASATDFRLIASIEELKALERMLRNQEQLALHAILPAGPPIWQDWVGISLAWAPDSACYLPFPLPDGTTREEVVRILAPLFTNSNQGKIGHGLKPLLVRLALEGVIVRGQLFDTEVAHYLLSPDESHTLGFVTSSKLNYEPIDRGKMLGAGKNARTLRELAHDEITVSACEEAALAYRLKDVLAGELKKHGLANVAARMEFPLLYTLAAMEETGVTIDPERLREIEERLTIEIARLEETIMAAAGKPFNIGSPAQVGHILFEHLGLPVKQKTTSGQPSTKEEVLLDLSIEHELPGFIIDWRKATRLQNAYIAGLRRMIHPDTRRVHTIFHQTVAATGRLSSSDPGLQNIPVRRVTGRELRRAFVAPPGWCLLSADYSQIELRILAHMSGDDGLAEIFRTGRDPHTETAARIYAIEAEEVTREQRNRAKAVNYGIPYGLSTTGLAQQLRCSREDAKSLMAIYHASFPGIASFLSRQVEIARERGYAETLWGRRRYLPAIKARNRAVRSAAERIAINMPIQGTQADMIKLAAVDIQRCLQQEGLVTRPILQVHDELVFEVPNFERDVVRTLVQARMVSAMPLSVPVEVDVNDGPTWLDAH